ncbi:MAG TPA: hypothetical protein VGI64_09850 [Streptosporangiaceae bacterium]
MTHRTWQEKGCAPARSAPAAPGMIGSAYPGRVIPVDEDRD